MAHKIHGTFVSEKINKIRWKPDTFKNCQSFITGSWDEEQNSIKLWDFHENEDSELYPYVLSEVAHEGDVTEALFLTADTIASSSSYGSVNVFKICDNESGEIGLKKGTAWNNIHSFVNGESNLCTSITCYDQDIVSVGEDGRINLLTLSSESIVRSYDNADSCSIKCALFLKHNEILTSNLRGQLKIWDLQSRCETPSSTFMLSGDIVAPTCLTSHPTHRHLVVAGDEEGSITIWDLRQNTYPVNMLRAHEESVMEIQFHPDYPDHLISSSSSGEIWHWSVKPKLSADYVFDNLAGKDKNIVWFASDAFKNKLEVFTLMDKLHKPINTFDVNQTKVLCGCDNEAIYLISGINLDKF